MKLVALSAASSRFPGFCFDTPLCAVHVPFGSNIHTCMHTYIHTYIQHTLRRGTVQNCGYCEVFVRESMRSCVSHHSRCAEAISVHEQKCTVKDIFSVFYQCLATRVNTVGRLLGTIRRGRHLQNTTRGTVTLGGASGALAVNLLNMRRRFKQWDEGKSRDSAKDNEAEAEAEVDVEVIEGQDKSQGCDGTGDVEGVAQVPKASDSALADATDGDTKR